MTWGLFRRFVSEMEPLRAEAMLDAAQAASVPHMGDGAKGWYDRTLAVARHEAPEPDARPPFTWNDEPLSIHELKRKFRESFGGRAVERVA